MTRNAVFLALAFPLGACTGRSITEGLTEPLAVQNAQFVEGELPGLRPLSIEEIVAEVPAQKPSPTSASTEVLAINTNSAGIPFSGLVSDDALSVAVTLKDESSGYWVFPAGAPDPTRTGFLNYSFVADFHESLPPGRHELLVAAVDAKGKSGNQASAILCVNSPVPDYGNACSPEIAPPDLVVSLSWDSPADLDLVVVTPTGKVVEPKNPTTAEPNERGQIDPTAPGVGNLQFDSNNDCVPGAQRENLVFRTLPRGGKYLIYANLNRACDERDVRYEVSFHSRVAGKTEGTYSVKSVVRGVGTLIAAQANAGTRLGTYVTDFKIGE